MTWRAVSARPHATAYPEREPMPRVSVLLQYYKLAPNIPVLVRWKDCEGVELIVNVDSEQPEVGHACGCSQKEW